MALELGETAPGPAAVFAQLLIGAEVAGLAQPLQHFIAFAGAILDREVLAAGPVCLEQIVGFQIRDVYKAAKTIKCGVQHGTTPTSQRGGCLEMHAVHSAFRGEAQHRDTCGKGIRFSRELQRGNVR